jgi:hypothetical protein
LEHDFAGKLVFCKETGHIFDTSVKVRRPMEVALSDCVGRDSVAAFTLRIGADTDSAV